jgi:hypothetical protein
MEAFQGKQCWHGHQAGRHLSMIRLLYCGPAPSIQTLNDLLPLLI